MVNPRNKLVQFEHATAATTLTGWDSYINTYY